jgi:hypothetical protein
MSALLDAAPEPPGPADQGRTFSLGDEVELSRVILERFATRR